MIIHDNYTRQFLVALVFADLPSLSPFISFTLVYHKVREYFVYRDDHGLGCMAIHLAHHCFSFNIRWIRNLTASCDSALQSTPLTKKSCKFVHGKGVK